jgi:hypothetical protein
MHYRGRARAREGGRSGSVKFDDTIGACAQITRDWELAEALDCSVGGAAATAMAVRNVLALHHSFLPNLTAKHNPKVILAHRCC